MSVKLSLLSLLLVATAWAGEQRQTALEAKVLLKVVHPAKVRKLLMDKAASLGGHHTQVTDHSLQIKVPPQHLSSFLRYVGEQGLLLEKTISRADLTEGLAKQEGRLRSKQGIFVKLREFFDGSNLMATLEIERNMRQLVQEMEQIKGQLRVLRSRASHAAVNIRFNYHQRKKLIYVRSPFQWLNSVGLDRFISEFQEVQ